MHTIGVFDESKRTPSPTARVANYHGNCMICEGGEEFDEYLVYFDDCGDPEGNGGYHTYCLQPGNNFVPEGNWYCLTCTVRQPQLHP